MCGIIGAVAKRPISDMLIASLRKLEYRGYDSSGIAILDEQNNLVVRRAVGKIDELAKLLAATPVHGATGIAHTRWATHGEPSERNAHPHQSNHLIALVHNGIIENYELLREQLIQDGYKFSSETDTEVIAHLLHHEYIKSNDFLVATQNAVKQLRGAYALGIINSACPNRLMAVRSGSPLVVGLGEGENFIASDTLALLAETKKFIFLHDGDIADVSLDKVAIYDKDGNVVQREIYTSKQDSGVASHEPYAHFMLKEIFEQSAAIQTTLENRISHDKIITDAFSETIQQLLHRAENIQIVACGTSYHAGLVARHWIETFGGIPCRVDIASEFRYRKKVVVPNTVFITISQSGETADTLAALRQAKTLHYIGNIAICNVAESSLAREADAVLLTRAGVEIGVCSTKAFTAQLTVLLLLAGLLSQDWHEQQKITKLLVHLPSYVNLVLQTNDRVKALAKKFAKKKNTLFLGRGLQFPIALEGALKLKEVSYIHAEAYPAGELKHGPLALVDKNMPVIAVVANDDLLEKMKSNLKEVAARGGQLIIFADEKINFGDLNHATIIPLPSVESVLAPIVYIIPLQLLSYYVALIKGTDVDQPRNLAKSVTVE